MIFWFVRGSGGGDDGGAIRGDGGGCDWRGEGDGLVGFREEGLEVCRLDCGWGLVEESAFLLGWLLIFLVGIVVFGMGFVMGVLRV